MAKKKKTQSKKKVESQAPENTTVNPSEEDSLYQLLDSKIEIPLSTLRLSLIHI